MLVVSLLRSRVQKNRFLQKRSRQLLDAAEMRTGCDTRRTIAFRNAKGRGDVSVTVLVNW